MRCPCFGFNATKFNFTTPAIERVIALPFLENPIGVMSLARGGAMKFSQTAGATWMALFWSCALVILILALIPPAPYLPSTGWDKTNHVLAFLVLTVLGCRAYSNRVAAVLLGAILYGGLIEVLQSFTDYRSAEWADLVADSVGVIAGRVLHAVD
jgi:VanZ family protein